MKEKQILSELRGRIEEEALQLKIDIDKVQNQLILNSKCGLNSITDDSESSRPPTAKELKEFSSKLQDEYLRSDSILKVAGNCFQ